MNLVLSRSGRLAVWQSPTGLSGVTRGSRSEKSVGYSKAQPLQSQYKSESLMVSRRFCGAEPSVKLSKMHPITNSGGKMLSSQEPGSWRPGGVALEKET